MLVYFLILARSSVKTTVNMSFLGKNYTFVKQENFEGFLKFVNVSDDKIEQLLKFHPDQKVVKDGDGYISITATPEGPKETKFKSGVEFDDVVGSDNSPVKVTYTVDGNTVTQKMTASPEYGTATFKREFNGDDLVVTITMDKWDGVAKRFYKAA